MSKANLVIPERLVEDQLKKLLKSHVSDEIEIVSMWSLSYDIVRLFGFLQDEQDLLEKILKRVLKDKMNPDSTDVRISEVTVEDLLEAIEKLFQMVVIMQ